MHQRSGRGTLFRAVSIFLAASFIAIAPLASALADSVTPAEKAAFLKAIDDTKGVVKPAKVCSSLLAIVPPPDWEGTWPPDVINHVRLRGDHIRWEGVPGRSRVLVAAFMSRADYETYYKASLEGGETNYTLRKSLWVTVAPELRNYFKYSNRKSCPPSSKRVLQLLGLNPGKSYDVILEMYVDPKDLFRPTPDPEITDHKAEVAVKAEDGSWVFPSPFVTYGTSRDYVNGPGKPALTYQEWFTQNALDSYDVDIDRGWGAPWTRLGYTYDWGSASSHVGPSEFIIRVHPYPSGTGGEVTVTLVRAVRSYDDGDKPANWNANFCCRHSCPRAEADAENMNPSLR